MFDSRNIFGFQPAETVARLIMIDLQEEGFVATLVGGCVRDYHLDVRPKDFDLATNADLDAVRRILDRRNMKALEVGAAFGILVASKGDIQIEIARFREESGYSDQRHPDQVSFVEDAELVDGIPNCVRKDAARRDLTYNALDFDGKNVFDPLDGLEDLKAGVTRFAGFAIDRIEEDPLRMLRYVRFLTRFGHDIDPEAFSAIEARKHLIGTVSAERVGDELTKILCGRNAGRGIMVMQQLGLLRHVLPEVADLCEENSDQHPAYHPEGNVLAHTCMMLDSIRRDFVNPTLAWGVLLHDVAKPMTHQVIHGIVTNRGHAEMGADIAEAILRGLKFSNQLIEDVKTLVYYHMRFMAAKEMKTKKIKKMLARPTIDDELELHRLDCRCSNGDLSNYFYLKQKQSEIPPEQINPKWVFSGKDLIDMGLRPGPDFGKILSGMKDEQLEGVFDGEDGPDRAQALSRMKILVDALD